MDTVWLTNWSDPSGYFIHTVVVIVQEPILPLQRVDTVVTVSFANACIGPNIANASNPAIKLLRNP